VRALPNVAIWDRCDVTGLVTAPDRDRVTGARVRPHTGGGAGEEQILAADLVVDEVTAALPGDGCAGRRPDGAALHVPLPAPMLYTTASGAG